MNTLRKTRQLWQRVLKKRRCPNMGTRQIRQLMAKLRIPGALSKDLTTNEIISKLKKVWKDIQ